MAGTSQAMKNLVDALSVKVTADTVKILQEYNPKIKSSLIKQYNMGLGASQTYPFAEFLGDLTEMTGDRKFQDMPEGFKFTVTNKKWDKGVRVKEEDVERAAALASLNAQMAALDFYKQKINELPILAKRHPVKRALTFLENGDASTYGTCFDGQNLFDTTHAYDVVAGSQTNIVSGTGATTLATIHADVLSAVALLKGFTYTAADDSLEPLNEDVSKVMIVGPVELETLFLQLKTQENISTTVKNSLFGMVDYVTRPFTDKTDYYVLCDDNEPLKPIIYQEEVAPKLDVPSPNDESVKKSGFYEYGIRYRGEVAYGAWWKAVMVTNS